MAIRSEDLYLSIPNASPLFSKLAISSQFKVSLDLVRRSQVGDNVGLLVLGLISFPIVLGRRGFT